MMENYGSCEAKGGETRWENSESYIFGAEGGKGGSWITCSIMLRLQILPFLVTCILIFNSHMYFSLFGQTYTLNAATTITT